MMMLYLMPVLCRMLIGTFNLQRCYRAYAEPLFLATYDSSRTMHGSFLMHAWYTSHTWSFFQASTPPTRANGLPTTTTAPSCRPARSSGYDPNSQAILVVPFFPHSPQLQPDLAMPVMPQREAEGNAGVPHCRSVHSPASFA